MSNIPFYIARDQYGQTITLGRTRSPRKALLAHFGRQHADKMYRDMPDGPPVHIGYVVAGHWCDLYRRMENPA